MKRNYIIPLQRVADLEAQECLLQGSKEKQFRSTQSLTDVEFDAKGQTHTSGDSWDEEW